MMLSKHKSSLFGTFLQPATHSAKIQADKQRQLRIESRRLLADLRQRQEPQLGYVIVSIWLFQWI